ncbi:MAG: hypothetical protein MJ252_04860 [archaeon]|nr:hypothetical protein [archaeon]
MKPNPRQLEPISFPKININPGVNIRPSESNNIKIKKPGTFSNTANIFFNQGKKVKPYQSTNIKDGLTKIKRIKLNSEVPCPIDEEISEKETENKEKKIEHESPENNHNNDSFINELEVLLTNVNPKAQDEDAKSVDEETPDPRINFEHINDINKYRPQTSYGGINQRKHKLQMALNGANTQNKIRNKNATQQNFMVNPYEFNMHNEGY